MLKVKSVDVEVNLQRTDSISS